MANNGGKMIRPLGEYSLRLPVGSAGRGKDDFLAAMLPHDLQQVQGIGYIVVVVFLRLLHRLTHIGIGSKVVIRLTPPPYLPKYLVHRIKINWRYLG